MKTIIKKIYRRLFCSGKCFIVWTEQGAFNPYGDFVHGNFTYQIKHYPYSSRKFRLSFEPYKLKYLYREMKANEHAKYQKALEKLSEFHREELLDLITLPKIEGINK